MILFTDILRQIRKGAPVEEATYALSDVVKAVDETGKPGQITVTIGPSMCGRRYSRGSSPQLPNEPNAWRCLGKYSS